VIVHVSFQFKHCYGLEQLTFQTTDPSSGNIASISVPTPCIPDAVLFNTAKVPFVVKKSVKLDLDVGVSA
jgi:hypothetical protein